VETVETELLTQLQEEVQLTLEVAEDLLTGQVTQAELGDQAGAEKALITLLKDKFHKLELMDLVAAEAALGQTEVEME
jgi:hypothetical protein